MISGAAPARGAQTRPRRVASIFAALGTLGEQWVRNGKRCASRDGAGRTASASFRAFADLWATG